MPVWLKLEVPALLLITSVLKRLDCRPTALKSAVAAAVAMPRFDGARVKLMGAAIAVVDASKAPAASAAVTASGNCMRSSYERPEVLPGAAGRTACHARGATQVGQISIHLGRQATHSGVAGHGAGRRAMQPGRPPVYAAPLRGHLRVPQCGRE